jgi:F420-non-reducing hydrogenase iron-sulfur subunit
MRLIRVMCSGRVDLEFILRAFANGQDGVFIGGCRLDECNYITHGNYDALANVYICKKIMEHIGLNPDRLADRIHVRPPTGSCWPKSPMTFTAG